ncbi:hypothetical protein CUB97_11640 [Prevotella intermedia]|uniref:Uncharacterized protein n=1 Tax=Prevotella intermedia TaxID=28131 RepID=A0A2M8M456_PREIN|nr:hypothetical protein CUB97_11640 [Prevotella intermedia]
MQQTDNHREKLHLLRRNVMNHAPTLPCIAVSVSQQPLSPYPISPFYDHEISLQKIGRFSLVFQKRRFYAAKQPLLPCKTYAFAMPNNRFWNAKA